MIKEPKSKSELTKSKGRKKKEDDGSPKPLGLFDHLKHIRTVQDPDYFKNLSETDKKSFNPFMLLRGLSMNPEILENIAMMYRYFDKVPSEQMYKMFIGGFIPLERHGSFHPWIKSKKLPVSKKIIELITTYFQISEKEALDYALLLLSKPNGQKELEEFCTDYGLTEREIKDALKDSYEVD